jgi:hypothetical protein
MFILYRGCCSEPEFRRCAISIFLNRFAHDMFGRTNMIKKNKWAYRISVTVGQHTVNDDITNIGPLSFC